MSRVDAAPLAARAGADDLGALRRVRMDRRVADRPRAARWSARASCWTASEWLADVQWIERDGVRRRGHRPDLIGGISAGGPLLPIEVELAAKSTQRLRAILGLHAAWIAAGKARAVIYVCATDEVADRVAAEARERRAIVRAQDAPDRAAGDDPHRRGRRPPTHARPTSLRRSTGGWAGSDAESPRRPRSA